MLRLKCGESVGVFFGGSSWWGQGGGRQERVEAAFSPENPKDSEGVWCCCWAGGAGARLQLRTDFVLPTPGFRLPLMEAEP